MEFINNWEVSDSFPKKIHSHFGLVWSSLLVGWLWGLRSSQKCDSYKRSRVTIDSTFFNTFQNFCRLFVDFLYTSYSFLYNDSYSILALFSFSFCTHLYAFSENLVDTFFTFFVHLMWFFNPLQYTFYSLGSLCFTPFLYCLTTFHIRPLIFCTLLVHILSPCFKLFLTLLTGFWHIFLALLMIFNSSFQSNKIRKTNKSFFFKCTKYERYTA